MSATRGVYSALLAMDASIAYEGLSNRSQDHQLAVRAFPLKVQPKFTGR